MSQEGEEEVESERKERKKERKKNRCSCSLALVPEEVSVFRSLCPRMLMNVSCIAIGTESAKTRKRGANGNIQKFSLFGG